MTRGLFFIGCIFIGFICNGQVISYNLATIPDSIKKGADVITQFENIVFTVEDIDDATYYVHTINTIVNEDGKDALDFHVFTSRFKRLGDAEIKLYDANGKLVSKYKKKDMMTHSMGEGLVDDGYVTYYSVSASVFPVTIEVEYEVKYKGTLMYPSYDILEPDKGVLQSSFTAKVPVLLGLRFKPKNINLSPAIKDDGKITSYTWEVKNLTPIEYEESAVSYENRYPSVLLAPNQFKMDEYEGDMTSWQNFGKWYAALKKGIDVLPEDKKQFFQEMVKNTNDDHDKTRIIYDYLQKNFRYVSIQLGIGGYKPF